MIQSRRYCRQFYSRVLLRYRKMTDVTITEIKVHDIRFPTSLRCIGSDSMHDKPNHAVTYVIIETNKNDLKGYGITSTLGRGNEFVVQTCKHIIRLVKNRKIKEIYSNFALFWRELTNDPELRHLGPECGVVHLAVAAIVNALWDLWARFEKKPVWQLLTEMTPEQLVSTIDFRYITDVVTKEEAIQMLKENESYKKKNEGILQRIGYPMYTADVGWWSFKEQQIISSSKKFKKLNFDTFKISVGRSVGESFKKYKVIRSTIGKKKKILVDANEFWDGEEAISAVTSFKETLPVCIEEPTSTDNVSAYAKIRKSLKKLKPSVQVTCGETCANRVQFKQFLKEENIDFWEINVGRLGGVNEALAVYFMAKKHNIPVWGHAGGIGLGEMIQHLQIWDFICLSQSMNTMIEYVNHQHGYFVDPIFVRNTFCLLPTRPGFSTQLKNKALKRWSYPDGKHWIHLFKIKVFENELNY